MPENTRSSDRENLIRIIAKWAKTDFEAELVSEIEALIASKVEEARKADSHHWDSETFAPITVCIRCATTFQIKGNKPCKGKMAKVALREPEALQSKEDEK